MYAWVVPSFVGIVIWVALAWRRVNRYAAWATTIVCFVVQLCCNLYFSHHGYSKTQTFIWTGAIYLPLGLITLIVVSLMTPREPQDNLDEFYALLHTPIGQEDRLKYAEVPILHY
jgi:Na+/proline symporter